ncbi:ABC transporter ATP-binding protein [Mycolicibacterium komossense]|uniref:ABC transporter ATP-binding protein n=1 Tax=Mycolicibacterium komossense TaxID=1779 RepID=A0ABT3CES1_9MYCO|nr:ABC transporter ATP-binding protein [Mycolicibacterium komossense]MCV7227991.1 ABC transporter ATP-binding protein [Mycolicibacterium komossense]
MRLIAELLRPYRWLVAGILLLMLIQTAMVVAAPWPLKIILDNVVGAHRLPGWLDGIAKPLLGGHSSMHIAALAAIMTALIAVVGGAAAYAVNYLTESVGQWIANDLRIRTYHHLQHLSLSYYDSHQVGPILSTVTDDVDTIEDFASSATLGMAVDVLTIGVMLGLMFWLDWDFALIAVAVAPLLLLFVLRIRRAVKAATHEVRRRQADIVTTVQEGLQSIRAVKAFNRQELAEQELALASEQTVAAALNARKVKSVVTPAVSVVVALCTAFVLWRGSWLILHGHMTAGTLTVFVAYLGMFFKPVQDLAKMTNAIAGFSVAVERVGAIVDTTTTIADAPDAVDPPTLRGQISFDNVSFSYDDVTPALSGVSFTVEPGQRVGIVGHTGSGKSTVLSLIARFYDVNAGAVQIDDFDVRNYRMQGMRKQIGFVLQDTVLFRGSIRDNIAFGRPDASDEEIVAAARIANADEFITRMPHGYDSPVGERGLSLSGGQRQRIGIARALIRDNPILLLDEPTAALDAESEQAVVGALDRLMADRTVVIIAHRFSTIRGADKIIVLDDGKIAELGDHRTLMEHNGIYAELYRLQYQDEDSCQGERPCHGR